MPLLELLATQITWVGYLIIFLLLLAGGIGLPFVDEAALFISGYLSYVGFTQMRWVILVGILGSVIGSSIGYWLGRTHGQGFLKWWFRILHIPYYRLLKLERYFQEHGSQVLLLSKFTIITRILAPLMAGMFRMPPEKFHAYNIAGALIWVPTITYLGYYFGSFFGVQNEWKLVVVLTAITLAMLFGLKVVYSKIKDYE